jgi:hypothetical protein
MTTSFGLQATKDPQRGKSSKKMWHLQMCATKFLDLILKEKKRTFKKLLTFYTESLWNLRLN